MEGHPPHSSTYPAAPLRDPAGNVILQHEVDHEAGHLAQEAGQALAIDVQGQPVAETQECHHAAPVDPAFKQAVGRMPHCVSDPHPQEAHGLPKPPLHPPSPSVGKQND